MASGEIRDDAMRHYVSPLLLFLHMADQLPAHYHRANRVAIEARWVTMQHGKHETETSMSDLITFSIYGGPDGGKITQVTPGVTTHSVGGFDYTLAQVDADRWAFLPLRDDDLLAAYQRTNGQTGNADADALLAEIQKRDLDI